MFKVKAAFPVKFEFIRNLMRICEEQACKEETELNIYEDEGHIVVSRGVDSLRYSYNDQTDKVLIWETIYTGVLIDEEGPTFDALDEKGIERHLQNYFGFEVE